jgi:hypothetical protein
MQTSPKVNDLLQMLGVKRVKQNSRLAPGCSHIHRNFPGDRLF